MEPELRAFFLRIVKSLSVTVLWMLIQVFLGIFLHFGFIYSSLTLANGLFYAFLLITFLLLIRYLIKLWKTAPDL